MNRAQQAARDIVEEFEFLDDWEDRYKQIIDMGRKLPDLPAEYRSDEHLLRGCQSVVHFAAEHRDGEVVFHAASDAAIVQGLIALLLRVYSRRTPREIGEADTGFLGEIGLDSHLSPTRKNGLASMIAAIKTEGHGSSE